MEAVDSADAQAAAVAEPERVEAAAAAGTSTSRLPTTEFNVPGQSSHSFSPLPCALEGQTCTVPRGTTVAYGADGRFVAAGRSGAFTCDSAGFGGDPAPGMRKACFTPSSAPGSRQVEHLGRGAIAMPVSNGTFLGWRLLGTEPRHTTFAVYGSAQPSGDDTWFLVPGGQAAARTNLFHANPGTTIRYRIVPVVEGAEQPDRAVVVTRRTDAFIDIPVTPPVAATPGVTYRAVEASVGDLRGTGHYDLVVKWEPSNAQDNGKSGYTDKTFVDAYTMTGAPRRLWRIDLGINIRSGAHYSPFVVYDLDGDGRAEVAMRTAEGTTDGRGRLLNGVQQVPDRRNSTGRVLSGPEWLTVFAGPTGRVLAQTPYLPDRGPVANWQTTWGDQYGGRMDRFNAGIAYLDGRRPSLIMQRGYYARTVVAAWDFTGDRLTSRWVFDTHEGARLVHPGYIEQGAHHLVAADLNLDGRDEVVLGAATIGHDGRPFHTSGLGHGDAVQVGDFDPRRAGPEIFTIHENANLHRGAGAQLRSGHNNRQIWAMTQRCDGGRFGDVGRGLILDVDPSQPGAEAAATGHGLMDTSGRRHPAGCDVGMGLPDYPMAIWWDGDLSRELWRSSMRVGKWLPDQRYADIIFDLSRSGLYSGADKGQALLQADLFGDWREEVVLYRRAPDAASRPSIRIYTPLSRTAERMANGTTPVPPIPTLMHDPQYRAAVASQNSGYNQSPNPSFFLGEGMPAPVIRPLHTHATLGLPSRVGEADDSLEGVHLRSALAAGVCLNANTTTPERPEPAALSVWGCTNVAQQRWTVTTHQGQPVLQVGDTGAMCLQTSQGSTRSGAALHTWPCDRASTTNGGRFFLNAANQIESADRRGMCVNVTNGATANGTGVTLEGCAAAPGQRWFVQVPTALSLQTSLDEGFCLNADATSTEDGTAAAVNVRRCGDDLPQQQWRLTSFHGQPVLQLGSRGSMCLQSSNARTEPGTVLHTWPCDQASRLSGGRYALNALNQLESVDSPGVCVEVPFSDARDGNRLHLARCSPTFNQRWSMAR